MNVPPDTSAATAASLRARQAAAGEARDRILAHLKQYPRVTAEGIGRVLKLNPKSVRDHLKAMEEDGRVSKELIYRTPGDPRPTARWSAT